MNSSKEIRKLAEVIYESKKKSQPLVLLLGNGASAASNIKPNNKIVEEVLHEYGEDTTRLTGFDINRRFNAIWSQNRELRETFRQKHLNGQPSTGYTALAHLIEGGYFSPVFSLNFDTLLEEALAKTGNGPDAYHVIHRTEENDRTLAEQLRGIARPTIVKLHKPYDASVFLYTTADLSEYPHSLKTALYEYFSRHMIVCGYSFSDLCVANVFTLNPQKQGDFYYVSPRGFDGADLTLIKYVVENRRTTHELKDNFDNFFCSLWEELFGLAIKEEFPYPIAKSFVNVEQASNSAERIKLLHLLFENTLRLVCVIAIADYPTLKKKRGAINDEFLNKLRMLVRDCDLSSIDYFCRHFYGYLGTVESDFFDRPIMTFLKDYPELRSLTERILEWRKQPDERLPEEWHREIIQFLLRLDFLRERDYVLSAIDQDFHYVVLKGANPDFSNATGRAIDYQLTLGCSTPYSRSGGRFVYLDPWVVLRDPESSEGQNMPDVCFYYFGYGVA